MTLTTSSTVIFPQYVPVETPEYANFRQKARRALESLPLPTDKKYTNWERLKLSERFTDKDIGSVAPTFEIDQPDYETGLKTIAIPLKKAILDWPEHVLPHLGKASPPEHDFFSALSGAFYTDGAAIVIPPGVKVDVTARFSAESGKLNAYRTILLVGDGAEATYTEELEDASATEAVVAHEVSDTQGQSLVGGKAPQDVQETLVAHTVEVFSAAGSTLKFFGLQHWSDQVTNFSSYRANMERDSRLDWLLGHFGSALTQTEIESVMQGEGAETNVHSSFFLSGTQHVDQRLTARHAARHTASDTYTRGLVADRAKTVYRGMIDIEPGAHGSSADQNGHAMLMDDTAHADMIPGLEIDANDVTAGHGATVGQLDEEKLFYLMARGIPENEARHMLLRGFFESTLRHIPDGKVRRRFETAIAEKLAAL